MGSYEMSEVQDNRDLHGDIFEAMGELALELVREVEMWTSIGKVTRICTTVKMGQNWLKEKKKVLFCFLKRGMAKQKHKQGIIIR